MTQATSRRRTFREAMGGVIAAATLTAGTLTAGAVTGTAAVLIAAAPAAAATSSTFYNPVAGVVDPTIVTDGGYYYLIGTNEMVGTSSPTPAPNVYVRKSSTIAGLRTATPTIVWTGPQSGLGSADLWSPVLEKVQGTWYIYLSVTDNSIEGSVLHAAVYALQGNATDPLGPYTLKNKIKTWDSGVNPLPWEKGIVGPSVTTMPNGSLYLTTTTFGFYIQQMSNPWTLSGSGMVTINDGSPTYPWEGGHAAPNPAGAEIGRPIVHTVGSTTKVFVPYTSENDVTQISNGTPCWNWCIGMFTNTDGNLTNPASWTKATLPVFSGGPDVGLFRILALSTFKSPDGTQDWIVYNGNDTAGTNFAQRDTFVQPFTWNTDGTPNFGRPNPLLTSLAVPSGETGSPPPLTPGTNVLASDFSTGSTGWTPLTGTWTTCGNQYCASGTGDNLTSAGATLNANYVVQAEVTPDNAPSGSGVDVIGRLQAANKFYEFELLKDSANNLKWVIAENRSGTYTILASGPYAWTAGTTYWMRFDLNEANLTALISTDSRRYTQLGSVRLTDLASAPSQPDPTFGQVGLRTWGGLTAHYTSAYVALDRPSMGFYTGIGNAGDYNSGWPGVIIDAGDSQELNKDFCVQQYNEYCAGGHYDATSATISTSGLTDPLPMVDYQTQRWNDAAPATRINDGSFHYVVPSLIPGQSYRVRLHFAEIHYSGTGQRVFNVLINGTQVLTNFDTVAAAGGPNKAVIEDYNAIANANGDIDLAFTPGTGTVADHNPIVNAIQVLPDTVAIDAGGAAQGTFIADRNYQSGSAFTTTTAVSTTGVANAGPASIYQSERYSYGVPGDFHYVISNLAPSKQYGVLLHFAEIYYTQTGKRAFNVLINGTPVLTNFDKVAAAGGAFKAVVELFTESANAAGQLDIHFTQGTVPGVDGNPTVSGVEVISFQT